MIFPFFSAENDWESLINIPLPGASILKVRIREGIKGKEVNSFNIYTSGSENWRASISKDANNDVVLHIVEGGCIIASSFKSGRAGSQFQLGASMGTIEIYKIGGAFAFDNTRDCGEIAARWRPNNVWLRNPLDGLGESSPVISAEMTL